MNRHDWIGGALVAIMAIGFVVLAIVYALRADEEAAKRHDFTVICEHEGGKSVTFDEGETQVCLRDGEVIKW